MGNCVDASTLDRAYEEIEKLKKTIEDMVCEKELERAKYFDKELQMLQEGFRKKEAVETVLRDQMNAMGAEYQAKIEQLQRELRNANNENVQIIQQSKASAQHLLETHADHIMKLEEEHKLVIREKDREIHNFQEMLTKLQQKENERLDEHLKIHSIVTGEMKAANRELAREHKKLQDEYVQLLQEVAEEKRKHLTDIKLYEKRLEEIRRVNDQGKFIVNHTFTIEPPQNNDGMNITQPLKTLVEKMKSNLDTFGGKLSIKDIEDYQNDAPQ